MQFFVEYYPGDDDDDGCGVVVMDQIQRRVVL